MDLPLAPSQNLVFDEDSIESVLYGSADKAPTPANVIEMCEREDALSEETAFALAAVLASHPEMAQRIGKLQELERLLRQPLEAARADGDYGELKTAGRLVALANLLQATGRECESEALYRHALEIQRKELGPRHEATLRTLECLAGTLERQGKRDEAPANRIRYAIEYQLRKGDEASLLNLRGIALELYRAGQYSIAEEIYRRLLERRFQPAGTCCHLARVLIMCDREKEARSELSSGWRLRAGALPYVAPRILFFQIAFALLDKDDPRIYLERMRHMLKQANAHQPWTMGPIIAHLRSRLSPDKIDLLKALAAALSDRKELPMLDQLEVWRNPNAPPEEDRSSLASSESEGHAGELSATIAVPAYRCTILHGDATGKVQPRAESGGSPSWLIEVAVTEEDHYQGLSNRPFLPAHHGMLFVFAESDILTFCMRRCFIGLDIAFISSDMHIVGLDTMGVESYGKETTVYRSPVPAQYALEVNAGELRGSGVREGDTAVFFDGATHP